MIKYYYSGPLYRRDENNMPNEIRLALNSLNAQRQRCNYKKSVKYKWYGARGIKVEYSTREFVGWYLENIKNKRFKKPVTSRIDHSKNYCFGNINLEECSENTKERCVRSKHTLGIGSVKRQKYVMCFKNGKHIATGTLKDVCNIFGMCRGAISQLCHGKNKKAKNRWVYKYI